MSRRPVMNVTGSQAAPSTRIPDELCPVCKRMRYLNPDMTFQINPECYHPMCSQCVTDIFKSGPAQCPYATCVKTLRVKGFHEAFFNDLMVEREVDIRRRVGAVFNMGQDDFETLRDYNNYLQEVEDLTFNLVSGDDQDRHEAEEKLAAYEAQHRAEIERNRRKANEGESARRKREAEERAAQKARRMMEEQEEEDAKKEEANLNRQVMEALSRGGAGSAAEIQDRILAKNRARVAQINGRHLGSGLGAQGDGLKPFRGLRQKQLMEDEKDKGPYSPFAGIHLEPARYKLQTSYNNSWLDVTKTDDYRVPGYSAQEYVKRAMFEAFSGLGVVVGDEKAGVDKVAETVGARELSEGGDDAEVGAA